jgi:calcyclin binding protein
VLKLAKVKGEYGFDHWSELVSKKTKLKGKGKEDPSHGIMEMMKEMYDNGDDKMKKMIGETMLKQRNGELGKDTGMGSMDF